MAYPGLLRVAYAGAQKAPGEATQRAHGWAPQIVQRAHSQEFYLQNYFPKDL